MLGIMTHVPVKPKFSESLGDSRFLSVDLEKDVTIGDRVNSGKRALLTAPRWVRLVEELDNIDSAVERAATLKPTQFKFHLRGNWHISVSDVVPFVDIRRWYTKNGMNLFPSLVGIILTYTQWNRPKEVTKMDVMVKEFEGVESCRHQSQREQMLCWECSTPTAKSLGLLM